MPTPPRTSLEAIVEAGARILEAEGLEALTMQAVARDVGVRAPSLYKHVAGRADLVRRIATQAATRLGDAVEEAAADREPGEALIAMAAAYRAFALTHPRTYGLLFSDQPEAMRIDAGLNARISEPLLLTTRALAGASDELAAGRMAVAWIHGFVSMELAGAFRLGGDVERAFDYGARRLVAAIDVTRARPPAA